MFAADCNETLEISLSVLSPSARMTPSRNKQQLQDDFVNMKQKYDLISEYISKAKQKQEDDLTVESSNKTSRLVDYSVMTKNGKKGELILTLRVIHSSSQYFPKGMEINICPRGLDDNYPFAMSFEHARQ